MANLLLPEQALKLYFGEANSLFSLFNLVLGKLFCIFTVPCLHWTETYV